MRVSGDLFEVDIISELHILGVNAENFETASGVRNTNVNFTIKSTETTESGVNRVRSVGGGHYDDVGASLKTIHESEELRDDTTFDFSISLIDE